MGEDHACRCLSNLVELLWAPQWKHPHPDRVPQLLMVLGHNITCAMHAHLNSSTATKGRSDVSGHGFLEIPTLNPGPVNQIVAIGLVEVLDKYHLIDRFPVPPPQCLTQMHASSSGHSSSCSAGYQLARTTRTYFPPSASRSL